MNSGRIPGFAVIGKLMIVLSLAFSASAWAAAPVVDFTILMASDGQQVLNAAATRDPDGGNFVTFGYHWVFTPDPAGASGDGAFIIGVAQPPGEYDVTLTVTDDEGEQASATKHFTVPGVVAENQPPVARDDERQITAGQSIAIEVLNNDSDPDGDALSLAGFDSPAHGSVVRAGDTLTYTPDDGFSGTDVFGYSISDGNGGTADATVRVHVSAPPDLKPTATFSSQPGAGDQALTVNFRWIGQSGDAPMSFDWDFGDGERGSGPNPVHVYALAGSYDVTLTVTDADGDEASATATVVLKAGKLAADFDFAIDPANPLSVRFTFTGSEGSGGLAFQWDFGDGQQAASRDPTHVWDAAGSYVVSLRVTDSSGAQAQNRRTVVLVGDRKPQASFISVVDANDPQVLRFTFSGLDGDGASDFVWDFGDGGGSNDRNPTHRYANPGNYAVRLTVTDADGDQDSVVRQVIVGATGPRPDFDFSSDPENPLLIHFAYTGTEGAGGLRFEWDFGDGQHSSDRNPAHRYANGGDYTVRLQVTDRAGRIQLVSKRVGVTNGSAPVRDEAIEAVIDTQNVTALEGDTITLSGRGFYQGKEVADLRWRQLGVETGDAAPLSRDFGSSIQFVAPRVPNVAGDTPQRLLRFELTASTIAADGRRIFNTDEVTVTVEDNGITEIPDAYLSSRSGPEQTPYGVKMLRGTVFGLREYALQTADRINVSQRPRRTPIGLVEMQMHPDETGVASVEFRLFEPLAKDYVWYAFSESEGWRVFPVGGSRDAIERDGLRTVLTIADRTDGGRGHSSDIDESRGVIRVRVGPGQISPAVSGRASVGGGGIGRADLLLLVFLALARSRQRKSDRSRRSSDKF